MFALRFKTENAAFCEEVGGDEVRETARILRRLADAMVSGDYRTLNDLNGLALLDMGGNIVGTVKAKAEGNT